MITSTKITLEEATIPRAEMTNRIKAWETSHDIEMYAFSLWPEWFEQHVNSMDIDDCKNCCSA